MSATNANLVSEAELSTLFDEFERVSLPVEFDTNTDVACRVRSLAPFDLQCFADEHGLETAGYWDESGGGPEYAALVAFEEPRRYEPFLLGIGAGTAPNGDTTTISGEQAGEAIEAMVVMLDSVSDGLEADGETDE